MNNSVHASSKSPEWYTPPLIIHMANNFLNGIDLDPCSNLGEPNIPAKKHYTVEDNGLIQDWNGKVYMNPPYGRSIGQWINKLLAEYYRADITEAIVLLPARTDTAWFQALSEFPVCFLRGRLKFSNHKNSAPFPSAIVYLGPNKEHFYTEFTPLGTIYIPRTL